MLSWQCKANEDNPPAQEPVWKIKWVQKVLGNQPCTLQWLYKGSKFLSVFVISSSSGLGLCQALPAAWKAAPHPELKLAKEPWHSKCCLCLWIYFLLKTQSSQTTNKGADWFRRYKRNLNKVKLDRRDLLTRNSTHPAYVYVHIHINLSHVGK